MVNDIKEKYLKNRESIFLVVFSAYYLSLMLMATMLNLNETVGPLIELTRKLCYLGMVCIFGANTLCGIYKLKELIIYAVVAAVLFLLAYKAGYLVTLILWLLMCCGKDVSFKKTITCALACSLAVLIAMFMLSAFGLIEDRLYDRDGAPSRHSFGFRYTTNLANFYLPILMMYTILRKKINLAETALLFWINLFIYQDTDTKSAFVFGLIVIIAFLVCRGGLLDNVFGKVVSVLTVASAPLAFAFCMGLQKMFTEGGDKISKINELVSGRLRLAQQAIDTYGYTYLGQKIEWIGGLYKYEPTNKPYNYVDSSFIQYLLNYGIVYIVFVLALFVGYGIKALKNKNTMLSLVFLIIVGHSIFDPQMMWLEFNPFLLYAFAKDDTV